MSIWSLSIYAFVKISFFLIPATNHHLLATNQPMGLKLKTYYNYALMAFCLYDLSVMGMDQICWGQFEGQGYSSAAFIANVWPMTALHQCFPHRRQLVESAGCSWGSGITMQWCTVWSTEGTFACCMHAVCMHMCVGYFSWPNYFGVPLKCSVFWKARDQPL